MTLTLYITDYCDACLRVKKQLTKITDNQENMNLKIKNIKLSPNKNLLIVPALFIEEELYAYGDINEKRLLKRIKTKETELSS